MVKNISPLKYELPVAKSHVFKFSRCNKLLRNTEEYFHFRLLVWNKKKREHSAIGITVILPYRLQVDRGINRRFHTQNIVIMIIKNVKHG